MLLLVDGGCAKGLIAGETYDFAIAVPTAPGVSTLQTFSKELKQPKGFTVPISGNLIVNVNSPVYSFNDIFTIKPEAGEPGVYNINYPRCPIPLKACEEIDNKFSVYVLKK
jgi:hypothetical protein